MEKPGSQAEYDFQLTSMKAMVDGAQKILRKTLEQRTERERETIEDYFIRSVSLAPGMDKEKMGRLREARKELAELEKALPRPSQAMVMVWHESAPKTRIRVKGQWNKPGVPVDADVPGVLPSIGSAQATRLELAKWMVRADNPLTPRVIANRIWQEIFRARAGEDERGFRQDRRQADASGIAGLAGGGIPRFRLEHESCTGRL